LCRPAAGENLKNKKFRLESENEETEFAVGGDSGCCCFIFFLFLFAEQQKTGKVEKVLLPGES
jgi:hypothetical protein